MSRYKEMSIAVETLLMANPIIDPLANTIEDEHLELHYDFLFEQGIDEALLEVIDDPIYDDFWDNLCNNFDSFFLDNGIAVYTYENDDYQLLSDTEKKMVDSRFAMAMLESAKKEIQMRIDIGTGY